MREVANVADAKSSQGQRRNLKKIAHGNSPGSTSGPSKKLLDFWTPLVHTYSVFCFSVRSGIHPTTKHTNATPDHFIFQKSFAKKWREFCLFHERLHNHCCSTCTQPPPAW